MKTSILIASVCVASTAAFAPNSVGRVATQLTAEKKSTPAPEGGGKRFFQTLFGMDLFAPVADQNNYGAREKKNLAQGKLTEKSYIPAGLTKEQYEKVRLAEQKKKEEQYKKNASKAGKFIDFTDFYLKRGTDLNQDWIKSPTKGHLMAKTKYDWSGKKPDAPLYTGVKPVEVGAAKKAPPKKK